MRARGVRLVWQDSEGDKLALALSTEESTVNAPPTQIAQVPSLWRSAPGGSNRGAELP
jgi:hypothetical protein